MHVDVNKFLLFSQLSTCDFYVPLNVVEFSIILLLLHINLLHEINNLSLMGQIPSNAFSNGTTAKSTFPSATASIHSGIVVYGISHSFGNKSFCC